MKARVLDDITVPLTIATDEDGEHVNVPERFQAGQVIEFTIDSYPAIKVNGEWAKNQELWNIKMGDDMIFDFHAEWVDILE